MSESYLAFGGKCAFALSLGAGSTAPEGKPEFALERDGKTYVFSGAVPRALFRVLPGSATRARKNWMKARRGARARHRASSSA
ncbi:hypothetical protein C6401_06095 [Arthrobacter woluwensis]|uniref:hypothetical protein n=1 Tax=Arthrobacter woluwensis TaxID=156980 RepID=UPI000D139077|nr:hypothetical protein [Arthrobacter woluwensis]PSS44821.1 hypothetical protein C6401_06095 [Arthrobacter woluwensis]